MKKERQQQPISDALIDEVLKQLLMGIVFVNQ